jgi:hypothetical protein
LKLSLSSSRDHDLRLRSALLCAPTLVEAAKHRVWATLCAVKTASCARCMRQNGPNGGDLTHSSDKTTGMPLVELHIVMPEAAPILSNLVELYCHDLSAYFELSIGADGRFGYPRLSR